MEQEYWWLKSIDVERESESAEIRIALAGKYKNDYSRMKQVCWKWYRAQLGRKDISSSGKLVLYCIVERFNKYGNWSCPDSFSYLASMSGLSSKLVAKRVYELVDLNVVWLVLEGDERRGMKRIKQHSRKRKHILLVGLGRLLNDHLA